MNEDKFICTEVEYIVAKDGHKKVLIKETIADLARQQVKNNSNKVQVKDLTEKEFNLNVDNVRIFNPIWA